MKTRILVLLIGAVVCVRTAAAQPVYEESWTVEARIAWADQVVLGTIDKVSHTLNTLEEKKSGAIDLVTVTVKIDEVLKGKTEAKEIELPPYRTYPSDTRFEEWSKAKSPFLWFVKDTLEGIERVNGTSKLVFLHMGKRVLGEKSFSLVYAPPVFSMQMIPLKESKEVLECARKYAKTNDGRLPTHTIRIPFVIARQCPRYGNWNGLVVPVDPALEKLARQLIKSPQDFCPKDKKLEPLGELQLRYGGTNALQHFKSAENVALLKSLLDEPVVKADRNDVEKPIRLRALEILLKWDNKFPLPKWADELNGIGREQAPDR